MTKSITEEYVSVKYFYMKMWLPFMERGKLDKKFMGETVQVISDRYLSGKRTGEMHDDLKLHRRKRCDRIFSTRHGVIWEAIAMENKSFIVFFVLRKFTESERSA